VIKLEEKKEDNLFRKTDGVLFNYENIKAEIDIIDIEIEEIREEINGVSGMNYNEKSTPTNAFNSSVENELLKKEKEINRLLKEKNSKERLVKKIDRAISKGLDEKEREIIKARCFERKSWDRVSQIVNIDGDYCCKIKKAAIEKISKMIWIREKYSEKVQE
jgi:DNA-directed RNA polymerase specialized sigma subunit